MLLAYDNQGHGGGGGNLGNDGIKYYAVFSSSSQTIFKPSFKLFKNLSDVHHII